MWRNLDSLNLPVPIPTQTTCVKADGLCQKGTNMKFDSSVKGFL